MTYASPWFGVLYVSAFAAALTVFVAGRRLAPTAAIVLGGYAVFVAAMCAGLALRGLHYDVSGEPFALAAVSAGAPAPGQVGASAGIDRELSVDRFARAGDARGVTSNLELRDGQDAQIDGWAYDAADRLPCSSVVVVVDAKSFPATFGLQRGDVAASLGSDHLLTGFRARISARDIGVGSHHVTVRCVTSGGQSYVGARSYSVTVKE